MSTGYSPSGHQELVADLLVIRSRGLPSLRRLHLPAVSDAARRTFDDPEADVAPLIEQLLRKTVEQFDGGPSGEAAAVLFGLEGGTRALDEAERRRRAADRFGRSFSTFRQRYESDLISDVADGIAQLAAQATLRTAHYQLAGRQPAESRLAVQWVERFDAYYRLWTPIYGLAADLTAYRSTMLDLDRPYDRRVGTDGPEDPGYMQEQQAEGYARFALYRFASFLWELKQFMLRYGGHWLLSSPDTEAIVSEAVYGISWHVTPFNERDESWLRSTIADSRGGELHHFLNLLARTDIGRATHAEWQEWVATCQCSWNLEVSDLDDHLFPTASKHSGVVESCQVHQVISACEAYCRTMEKDWLRVADWYHIDGPVGGNRTSAEGLYARWSHYPGP